jgi:hypothetical protein
MIEATEVTAKTTGQQIAKDLLKGLDFVTVLKDLGGGNETEGLAKVQALSEKIGVNWQDVVDILRGKMTPASAAVLAQLQEETAETVRYKDARGSIHPYLTDEAQIAQKILDTWKTNTDKVQEATGFLASQRDYLKDTVGPSAAVAGNLGAAASAAERIAAAAERWAGRRLPDPTQTT